MDPFDEEILLLNISADFPVFLLEVLEFGCDREYCLLVHDVVNLRAIPVFITHASFQWKWSSYLYLSDILKSPFNLIYSLRVDQDETKPQGYVITINVDKYGEIKAFCEFYFYRLNPKTELFNSATIGDKI